MGATCKSCNNTGRTMTGDYCVCPIGQMLRQNAKKSMSNQMNLNKRFEFDLRK